MRTASRTAMLLAIALTVLIPRLASSQEPVTLTIGQNAYCYTLDSAEKIAREDSLKGMTAASDIFSEAGDCSIGAGQVMILGVLSEHKVSRNGNPRILYVYEAANPILTFYIISTQKFLKEDPDT